MRLSFGGDEALGADETSKQQEHCICGNRKSRSAFMICCDYCDMWFHGSCVQVTRVWADQIDKYCCPLCVSLSPSRVTVYKNDAPPVTTPKRGRPKAAATPTPTTPTRKCTARKRTTTGTPTRRRNPRNIDFAAEEEKDSGNRAPVGDRLLPSAPVESMDDMPIAAVATRMTVALLTSSRFSISPEKPLTGADGLATDRCEESTVAVAQSANSWVGSTTTSAVMSVAGDDENDDPMDQTLSSPPSEVKYLDGDEGDETSSNALITPLAGSSPAPIMDVLPVDDSSGVDTVGSAKADYAAYNQEIDRPTTAMSTGSVGEIAKPPQRIANGAVVADEENKNADRPLSATYSSSATSNGDDGAEEEEDVWSDITPVDRSTTTNCPNVYDVGTSAGASSHAVLAGYFADFRERNGCAARLNEFLLADDFDDGISDEDTKPHNHSRQHSQRHSLLERRISHLSNETSPDKQRMNIARRQLIYIPETPEEKLRSCSASSGRVLADLATAINGADSDHESADVEIVPQTPIGKIRRESIVGKSRLDTLLKENDAGSLNASSVTPEPIVAAASRKRARSSRSIMAATNSAKRSLFR